MSEAMSTARKATIREDRHGALPRSATNECLAQIIAPAGWATKPELPPDLSWPQLLEASSEHVVTLALAWRMADDERVPPALRKHLQAALALGRERNRLLRTHLGAIGRILNDEGIVPTLLKGASYLARNLYPDDGMRYMGDIDLLVPAESLGRARATLERQGFVSAPADTLQRDHHHLPLMHHAAWGVAVELHRRPVGTAWSAIIDEEDLLREGTSAPVGEATFLLPSPTHSVVMGIVHSQLHDGGHRLRRPWLRALLDFARQVEVFGPAIDWHEIEARLRAAPRGVLAEFLVLAEHLMTVPVPLTADAEARLAPLRMARALDRPAARRTLVTTGDLAMGAWRMLTRLGELRLRSFSRSNWRRRFARYARRW